MDVNKFKGKLNELYKEAKALADSDAIITIEDITQKRKQYQKKISALNSQGKELFDANNKVYNKEITDTYIEFCNKLNALVTEFKRANPLELEPFKPLEPEQDEIVAEKKEKKKNRHSWFGGKEKVSLKEDKSESEEPLLESSI